MFVTSCRSDISETSCSTIGTKVFESLISCCIVANYSPSHFLKIRMTHDYSATYGDYTTTFVDYSPSRRAGDLTWLDDSKTLIGTPVLDLERYIILPHCNAWMNTHFVIQVYLEKPLHTTIIRAIFFLH